MHKSILRPLFKYDIYLILIDQLPFPLLFSSKMILPDNFPLYRRRAGNVEKTQHSLPLLYHG